MENLLINFFSNCTTIMIVGGLTFFLSMIIILTIYPVDLGNNRVSRIVSEVGLSGAVVWALCLILLVFIETFGTPISRTFKSGTRVWLDTSFDIVVVEINKRVSSEGYNDLEGVIASKNVVIKGKILCQSKGINITNTACWNKVKQMSESELIRVSKISTPTLK